jgi:hypothetical protein
MRAVMVFNNGLKLDFCEGFQMEAMQLVEPQATAKHGGARPGAGRKPKALVYASEIATAEGKIVSAMPSLIDSLISAAQAGDTSAARYLLDRVLGRVKEQAAPLSEDTSLPLTDEDAELLEAKAAAKRKQEVEWAALGVSGVWG